MKYTNADCVQFVVDMEASGLPTQHYRGRFFWQGPASSVDNIQDVLSNTKVKCQWDNLGLGWIVYPKASDPGSALIHEFVPEKMGVASSQSRCGIPTEKVFGQGDKFNNEGGVTCPTCLKIRGI